MGAVYLAKDTKLDRKVALKVLPHDVASQRDRMERFIREAKAAAALNHPNIAHVYDIGETNGTHYIAMEYIEGETLRDKIHRDKAPLAHLLKYLTQVGEGLSKAHAAGIVHRDLKPDNIMVTRDDYAKVLDFGLAKLVEPDVHQQDTADATDAVTQQQSVPGVIFGTIGYMSPEQAQGKTIDRRSDIFSFGCVLFEAITHHRPFEDESTFKSLHKVIFEAAPSIKDFNPSAPADLQRIVRRCLAKDPDQRYQTIKDVAIELQEVASDMEGADSIKTQAFNLADVKTDAGEVRQTVTSETTSIEKTSASSWVENIKRHKLVTISIVALLALVVGVVAYSRYRETNSAIDSIAVLPFENRGGDPDTDYLSDGLTESLIYRLSQLPSLKVSPTSLVFRFKGQTDPIKAGSELGVNAVLSGRITQRGDNLTINAELVDVRNSRLLWGEQYERKISDLLATQREIAREIAEKLRPKVTGQEKALAKNYTDSNEAYQLYLKGRFYWGKRTEDGMLKSLDYYQQAIQTDPEFALAYSGLADSYDLLGAGDASGALPATDAFPKAKAAALKALQIDDTLAEPHVSLAHVKYYYDRDWAGAEREYQRAIELNPNYPTAHSWYAIFLMSLPRFDEALVQVRQAKQLDPLSLPINMAEGWVLLCAGKNDESVDQLRKTIELDPNFVLAHHRLGIAYEQQGKFADAINEFTVVNKLTPGKPLGIMSLAHAYALAGKRAEAQKFLDELLALSKQRYVSSAGIALVYAALGDKEQAFAWLARADKERDGILVRIKVDSRFDSLRSDPRFTDLVKRMGLTP